MVELKHCPSKDTPVDHNTDFFTRLKEHAIEFYEASPEEHTECLRNTFNKYMSKLSAATAPKHAEAELAVTTGAPVTQDK